MKRLDNKVAIVTGAFYALRYALESSAVGSIISIGRRKARLRIPCSDLDAIES
jgi:hypothetical protein